MSVALRNPGSDTIHAAQKLLDANPDRPEDHIRQDIGRLLDSLGIDNFLTYRTPAGPADIFLPNRRVFIETKSTGLAGDPHREQTRENPETPFQQLENGVRQGPLGLWDTLGPSDYSRVDLSPLGT